MVPNDAFQGAAAAIYLRTRLRARTYYLVNDGTGYGRELADALNRRARVLHEVEVGVAHMDVLPPQAVRQLVSRLADQIVSVTPDAVYCGCTADPSAQLARALGARGFRGAFFVADAEHNAQWPKEVGTLQHPYLTDPGIDDNRTAGWFRRAFAARFHAVTQPFDAYAYDAASAALRALYSAAVHHQLSRSIGQRRLRIASYVGQACFQGASGPVSFDRNGDTTNRSVSVYASELGSWHLLTVIAMGRPTRCR
jgi:branched-chain amino acid transport system substrate-binding protein